MTKTFSRGKSHCVHKVSKCCTTASMWTYHPESRVLWPWSVNVMSRHFVEVSSRRMGPVSTKYHMMYYRHLVDTSSRDKGPVSTKYQCDALQTLYRHIFPRQGSCVHKVSMWCPTASLWTHLPESRVLYPQSGYVMPYRHFIDTSSRSKGHLSIKCQYDALQTLRGQIFPRQGSCVHKVSYMDALPTFYEHVSLASVRSIKSKYK